MASRNGTPGNRMNITIRAELPEDAEAIRRVVAHAFPTQAEADLVEALRRSGELIVSLVASDDDEIVGHVAFSPVLTSDAREGIGLAPVAVNESHRCHGVAARLIGNGLDECRALGFRYAVVLGEPPYYSRFGFQPAARHGLTDEYGGGDAFQVLALEKGGIPESAGLVRYCAAFSAFS